jgi:hypothetical protein
MSIFGQHSKAKKESLTPKIPQNPKWVAGT